MVAAPSLVYLHATFLVWAGLRIRTDVRCRGLVFNLAFFGRSSIFLFLLFPNLLLILGARLAGMKRCLALDTREASTIRTRHVRVCPGVTNASTLAVAVSTFAIRGVRVNGFAEKEVVVAVEYFFGRETLNISVFQSCRASRNGTANLVPSLVGTLNCDGFLNT